MSGIDRNAKDSLRLRRNQQRTREGAVTGSITVAAPLQNTGSQIQLNLVAAGGLENSSGSLQINLDTNPGLTLATTGLKVLLPASSGLELISTGLRIDLNTNSGLELVAAGLQINLDTDPGLVLGAGGIKILLPANSGLTLGATGLTVAAATTTVLGAVKMQTLIADQGVLTDNSGGTSGAGTIAAIGIAVTDPGDAPADADALREDLVANTIPSIETELSNLRNAVATLAAYCTTLEDKINEMLAAEKTAGQMSAV